jgi:hypothetical protein
LVHEQVTEKQTPLAKAIIAGKNQCLFLGFGFHPMNIETLRMRSIKEKEVYCTGWGYCDNEIEQIKKLVGV